MSAKCQKRTSRRRRNGALDICKTVNLGNGRLYAELAGGGLKRAYIASRFFSDQLAGDLQLPPEIKNRAHGRGRAVPLRRVGKYPKRLSANMNHDCKHKGVIKQF